MDETVTISVCPNGCYASLIAEAEVTQKWEVDCEGNTVEMLESDEPTFFDSIKCKACYAETEDVDCFKRKVYSPSKEDKNSLTHIGTLYLPIDEGEYVYYIANGDNAMQRLEINYAGYGTSVYVVIDGNYYFIEADDVRPDTPLEGQQSLF